MLNVSLNARQTQNVVYGVINSNINRFLSLSHRNISATFHVQIMSRIILHTIISQLYEQELCMRPCYDPVKRILEKDLVNLQPDDFTFSVPGNKLRPNISFVIRLGSTNPSSFATREALSFICSMSCVLVHTLYATCRLLCFEFTSTPHFR